jgi:hypothetical protein
MGSLYDTDAYFDRAEALFLRKGYDIGSTRSLFWRRHPLHWLRSEAVFLAGAIGLFLGLMLKVPSSSLRREYRRRFARFLKVQHRPGLALFYLFHIAMHYHAHTLAEKMKAGEQRLVNSF